MSVYITVPGRCPWVPLVKHGPGPCPRVRCRVLRPHPLRHVASSKGKTARRAFGRFFHSLAETRSVFFPLTFYGQLFVWPHLKQRKLEDVVTLYSLGELRSLQSLPCSLSIKVLSLKDFLWSCNNPVNYSGEKTIIFKDLKFKKMRNVMHCPKLLMMIAKPGPKIWFSSAWSNTLFFLYLALSVSKDFHTTENNNQNFIWLDHHEHFYVIGISWKFNPLIFLLLLE